jgi:hypothetical protein
MYESGGRLSPGTRRSTQMGEFVTSLVQAHQTIGTALTANDLVVFSIAGYLCEDLGPTVESFGTCKPPPRMAAAVVKALAQPDSAYACILKLDELAEHSSWERFWGLANQRSKELKVTLDDELAGWAFHSQGVLWTHFLMDANQGRERARYLAFLRYAMQGTSSGSTLRGAFEGVQLDQLTREFLAWVVALDSSERTATPLPPGTIEGLFKGPPVAARPAANGATPTPVAAKPKGFDVGRLRTPAGELETQHGLALARAAAGHLGEAAKRIGELAALTKETTERERLERERTRLAALDAARAAILQDRITTGKKLQFNLPDKKLVVNVRAVEGEWMMLGENRSGVERLPLSDFSLDLLAKELPNPTPQAWMKPYLQLLTSEGRTVKLNAEDRALADLRADAASVAERLQQGLVALEFESLADRGLPRDTTAALDAVDALRKLLAIRARSPLVQARREALREFARETLGTALRLEDVPGLFGGQCELLADGQVTWTLEFDRESDAALFTPIKDGWLSLREYLSTGRIEIEPKLEPRDGGLAVRGSGAWVSTAAFRSVSAAHARGKHAWDPNKREGELDFRVLLGYREPQRYLGFSVTGDVVAFDAETSAYASEFRTNPLTAGVPYETALSRAEGKVTVTCGSYSASIDDLVEPSGHVALFSYIRGYLVLDRLAVTGFPDFDLLRPIFVQRELAKLGL